MAYCIRCGYKCSFLRSLSLKGDSICNDCLEELGVTADEKSKYSSMNATYELLLADVRLRSPELLSSTPGERTGDDHQAPAEMPDVRSFEEILNEHYIETPELNLDSNEKCYYKGILTLSFKDTKKVVTGGGTYSGVSFNLGHGIRYGIGTQSAKKTKTKEVTTSAATTFYVTSKRFYFEVKNQYFSIFYKDIDSITWNFKSFDVISGVDNLNFSTIIMPINDIEQIFYLIQQNNKEKALSAPKPSKSNSKKKSAQKQALKQGGNNADPIQMIREYKKLLDEGILTQEEFDRKKAEILNL